MNPARRLNISDRTLFSLLAVVALLAAAGAARADEYFVSGENVETASIVTYSPSPQVYYQNQHYRPYSTPVVVYPQTMYQQPMYQQPIVVPVQRPGTVVYVNQPTRYYPFGGHPQARFIQPQPQMMMVPTHHHHPHR